MKIEHAEGDIWKLRRATDFVVVPTNVGWTKDGLNVMGRGIASDAARQAVEIRAWYGAKCKAHGKDTPTLGRALWRMIFFPTKPLARNPSLSWKQDATLERIQQSLPSFIALLPRTLEHDCKRVLLPHVGCGNGGLSWEDVGPVVLGALNSYEGPSPTIVVVDHKAKFDHRSAWIGNFLGEGGED